MCPGTAGPLLCRRWAGRGITEPDLSVGTRRGLVFGWVGVLLFSGTVVATRFAAGELDATFIALGRALVAAVLAAGVLAARRAPWPSAGQWGRLALVSAGVVVSFPWLITLALRSMPAAHGALALLRGGEWVFAFYRGMAEAGIAGVSQIQLGQPVLSLVWSALFLGERIDPSTVAAALFVVGCVVVTLGTRVRLAEVVPEAP